MRDIHRQAISEAALLAKEAAEDFDSSICHNVVHETVDGAHDREHDLLQALDLRERSYDLADRTDIDLLDTAAFDAAESLNDTISALVDIQVARACETVVVNAPEWTDAWSEDKIDAAVAEAREWLTEHPGPAGAAGVEVDD